MPRHLYSLDVARGIAALSVVLWHWSHFRDGGGLGVENASNEGPLYGLFFLFYERGALAVDFFFSLSGFVFFWLYRDRLLRGEVGGWDFFLLRFSRLYPLHLLTLLVTAGLMFGWTPRRLRTSPDSDVGENVPRRRIGFENDDDEDKLFCDKVSEVQTGEEDLGKVEAPAVDSAPELGKGVGSGRGGPKEEHREEQHDCGFTKEA